MELHGLDWSSWSLEDLRLLRDMVQSEIHKRLNKTEWIPEVGQHILFTAGDLEGAIGVVHRVKQTRMIVVINGDEVDVPFTCARLIDEN